MKVLSEKVTTGVRLKQVMLERGLKQSDIIELTKPFQREYDVKLGKTDLSQYVNDKVEPRQKKLFIIAKALNVSEAWLMGYPVDKERKVNKKEKDITTIYRKLNDERKNKVYSYAQHELEEQNKIIDINEHKEIYLQSKVSAGTGVLDLDPTYGETITYSGEIPNHYDLAFLVSGNSMTPTFEDGEIIFVEKYPNPINGAIMVVQIDNEAFIKKVYLEKDNLRLVSLNQDYDDILANGDNNIRIVGKVVF